MSEKIDVTVIESDTGSTDRCNATVSDDGVVLQRGEVTVTLPWDLFQGQNTVWKGKRQSQLSLILCGKGKVGVPVRTGSGKVGGFITMLLNINVPEATALAYGADEFPAKD